MRVRSALIAAMAAASLASGCAAVDGGTVARVGDVEIPFEVFDDVMALASANVGLAGDVLGVAERAVAVGLLDRTLLDSSLITVVQAPEFDVTMLPDLPAAQVDALYTEQVGIAPEPAADLLERIGIDEARWRDVFGQVVRAEIAGLFQTGGQPFELARATQLSTIQSRVLSQLIEFEFTRQLTEELEIEVTDEDVDAQLEFVRAAYATEEEFTAAVRRQGFTVDTFRDMVVASQVRTTALQGVADPDLVARLQAYFEQIDIDIAPRFGDFDVSLGITPPQPLDG